MIAELVVVAGPVKGTRFALSDEVTIGRHSSNGFCIGDPSVSRFHCVVRPSAEGYTVADVGSNNGTLINGAAVTGVCTLRDGDRIIIGDTELRFAATPAGLLGEELAGYPEPQDSSTLVLSREEAQALGREALRASAYPLERTSRQLRALLNVGGLLAGAGDLSALQLRLLQIIAEVLPADSGAVVLCGYRPTDTLTTVGWRRSGAPTESYAVSETVLRRVLLEGAAILSSGPVLDQQLTAAKSLVARRVRSVMCVPLLLGETLHGALYFEALHASFDEDHLRLVTAVAGYATLALNHARRMEVLETENRYLRSQALIRHSMVGESPRMKGIYERIRKFAQADTTILIVGESGTGKELVARALHQNSRRAGKPFEAINCALLREDLLESELFGHEKGAFTGAAGLKRGKFELAQGGTVFLDEIGELPYGPQAMLLRFLQDRQFTRLGGTQSIRADVRLIAATNRDLEQAVKEKEFRQDLYYRLNVVCLRMPALRERPEDIGLLAQHFVRQAAVRNGRSIAGISPAAMALLRNHTWPGNVRELENAVEHAVVFGSADEIMPEDLPEQLLDTTRNAGEAPCRYHEAVHAARAQIVLDALAHAGGNYVSAAESLGIHPNNLHRLVRQLNLKPRLKKVAGGHP
jgi:Nif-specific regulatory protein